MIKFDGEVSLSDIRKITKKPGVYFVFNSQGEVVYIGSSQSIYDRWLNHHVIDKLGDLADYTVKWIIVPVLMLDKIEKSYIQRYSPPLNGNGANRGNIDINKPDSDLSFVTVKIYDETRHQAKIRAYQNGTSMVKFIHDAVMEKIEREVWKEASQPIKWEQIDD